MAMFPCQIDGKRYTGAQNTVYLAVVLGAEADRLRLRVCRQHYENIEAWCREFLVSAASDGDPSMCACCSSEDLETAIFFTLYGNHDDRRDFYGRLCDSHRDTPAEILRRIA